MTMGDRGRPWADINGGFFKRRNYMYGVLSFVNVVMVVGTMLKGLRMCLDVVVVVGGGGSGWWWW